MKNRCVQNAMACVGAVIGAGFASGREVLTFFTRYGQHSWWLIMLSTMASVGFCALIMQASADCGSSRWHTLHADCALALRVAARACVALLVTVVSGAMLSASGHMIALLWASDWAYPIGVVGTLLIAWRLGFGSLKPLSVMSWVLTVAMLIIVFLLMRLYGATSAAAYEPHTGVPELIRAALRAVAYAGMNMTIAIGVVCGCSGGSRRGMCRSSALFGLMLLALLFVSNRLYLMHPELEGEAFPIVRLLGALGRAGYMAGAALLYLALFTTLIALMRALRGAVEAWIPRKAASALAALMLPLLMSFVGFAQIVEGIYAPIGCLCILLVLIPLALKRSNPPSAS